MLAVEVANIQTEVWERRDGRRCESRAWRFVDVDDLATCDCDVYTQLSLWLFCRLIDQWPFQPLMDKRGKAVLPAQDWPSIVRSWESLACLQVCSGSPVRRWWKPCSYRIAAQWPRSCLQSAPRCSAGICWVVGLRQHFCCRALRRAFCDPPHAEHIQRG